MARSDSPEQLISGTILSWTCVDSRVTWMSTNIYIRPDYRVPTVSYLMESSASVDRQLQQKPISRQYVRSPVVYCPGRDFTYTPPVLTCPTRVQWNTTGSIGAFAVSLHSGVSVISASTCSSISVYTRTGWSRYKHPPTKRNAQRSFPACCGRTLSPHLPHGSKERYTWYTTDHCGRTLSPHLPHGSKERYTQLTIQSLYKRPIQVPRSHTHTIPFKRWQRENDRNPTRWWPQTAKQDGNKTNKKFVSIIYGKKRSERLIRSRNGASS